MKLRPLGVFLNGRLERGLEVEIEPAGRSQRVVSIRATREKPDPFVLSPAFCNAHSHLEYRGLQGTLPNLPYWQWLRELTKSKIAEAPEAVRTATHLAARENRATGVALIAEHSDRPYAAEAMEAVGLRGTIYQELITFAEQVAPQMKRIVVEAKRKQQHQVAVHSHVRETPHAPWTVDDETLRTFSKGAVYSMHVAETPLETEFFKLGKGPIAELYRNSGFRVRKVGVTVVEYLREIGLVHDGAQWVHCCDLRSQDIVMLAENGVAIAHCPRSNQQLECPHAPIRRLWDAGCIIGLGLDSPASSGPIDMFAEMRSADEVGHLRGEPLPPEMIWSMATTVGARSIGISGWEIKEGNTLEMIAIRSESHDLGEVIQSGEPASVSWVADSALA